MFDFIKKFNLDWSPAGISNEADRLVADGQASSSDINVEELQIAQRLCEHLNLIRDYQDRIDSIDYLANQARMEFDNITFTTASESLINSIISIGGKDGTVDFELVQIAIDLIVDFMDKTALEAVLGEINA